MFDGPLDALRQASLERVTLFVNHVLAAEPQATRLLTPHAGRTLDVQAADWPSLLPAPRTVRWSITRAGLLEFAEAPAAGEAAQVRVRMRDLRHWLDSLQPGTRPPIDFDGDPQFVADLDWVVTNVRWDVADDLSRLVGDAPAHQLVRAADSAVRALQRLAGSARS